MKFSESGWLFQNGKMQNIERLITDGDIMSLWELADEDDMWTQRIRQEIEYCDKNPNYRRNDYIIDEIRCMNTYGTVVDFPFGDILTFASKRHFFRGERKKHSISIPSLNRRIYNMNAQEQELWRIISNMRIEQFCKLLWNIEIVPQWEGTICDVNYKALAQHYGFETQLLDLTNDFRSALFFAVSRYDYNSDSYYPLSERDIMECEESQYGVIFHSPNWELDYMQPMASLKLMQRMQNYHPTTPIQIDSGLLDGIACQIGFQPLHRCHCQNGYLLPMRTSHPLQLDERFEKLYFRQSVKLSNNVYEWMHGGERLFPHDGITKLRDYLREIQNTLIFSEDDLLAAYKYWGVDHKLFPTINQLKEALSSVKFKGNSIEIIPKDVEYRIPKVLLDEINKEYRIDDIKKQIGDKIFIKPEQATRRKERYKEIFGIAGE